MDRCDECGFVYDEVDLLDALDELRCLPDGYGAHLRPAEAAGLARQRPDPQTW